MADGSNGNDWGSAAVTRTDESDWGSLGPSADEGWGQKVSDGWGASAMDGWTVANIKANPTQQITRKEGPPLARNAADDEPKAEKEVDKICASALDGKKKIAAIRAQLDDLDEKRAVVQGQIDELMPELQEIRAQKGTALGVVQGARMPALWTDKAREMNTRRKTLPGGCTTTLELKRAIKETERSIEHGSLSLKEEKAALDRVRELNRGALTLPRSFRRPAPCYPSAEQRSSWSPPRSLVSSAASSRRAFARTPRARRQGDSQGVRARPAGARSREGRVHIPAG